MQLSLLEPWPELSAAKPSFNGRLNADNLRLFIPETASGYIFKWFGQHQVRLRIASARSSKFGDYRPQRPDFQAIISVNNNLNPYDFLITLVHEMAHDELFSTFSPDRSHRLYRKKADRPKPHGPEWKSHFFRLMQPLMNTGVFPEEVLSALRAFFEHPGSSGRYNHLLALALKKYDIPDGKEFLQDLPQGTIFYIPGGRAFRKQEQVRKRFRCQSLSNRRIYLFSPLATVSRHMP